MRDQRSYWWIAVGSLLLLAGYFAGHWWNGAKVAALDLSAGRSATARPAATQPPGDSGQSAARTTVEVANTLPLADQHQRETEQNDADLESFEPPPWFTAAISSQPALSRTPPVAGDNKPSQPAASEPASTRSGPELRPANGASLQIAQLPQASSDTPQNRGRTRDRGSSDLVSERQVSPGPLDPPAESRTLPVHLPDAAAQQPTGSTSTVVISPVVPFNDQQAPRCRDGNSCPSEPDLKTRLHAGDLLWPDEGLLSLPEDTIVPDSVWPGRTQSVPFSAPQADVQPDSAVGALAEPMPESPESSRPGARPAQDPLPPDMSIVPITDEPSADRQRESGAVPSLPSSILQQTQAATLHGVALVKKGSYAAAQEKFLTSLRTIAKGLDAEQNTTVHSDALTRGLKALDEAAAFVAPNPPDPRQIASHQTPVLQGVDWQQMTPLEALRRYHAFAEGELIRAGGRQSVASRALFGLAKVQILPSADDPLRRRLQETRAITLFQASFATDPTNGMAANELGVLLARHGQLTEARDLLRRAVQTAPAQPTIWKNLAVVHRNLGEQQLASLALEEWRLALALQTSAALNADPPPAFAAPDGTFADGSSSAISSALPTDSATSNEPPPPISLRQRMTDWLNRE